MKKAGRHTLILDRWVDGESAAAELDGESMVVIPRVLLPAGATPDDVLRVESRSRTVTISIDREATRDARRAGARVAARLNRRDPGGDVVL
ncbi:MAG: DUF3006 family protein [Gemmatimonadaceae bacterium]